MGAHVGRNVSVQEGDDFRLIDRMSDAPCSFGRSWGYNRREIWVDNGCRAVFEVRW